MTPQTAEKIPEDLHAFMTRISVAFAHAAIKELKNHKLSAADRDIAWAATKSSLAGLVAVLKLLEQEPDEEAPYGQRVS